jgi:hypothetical protein
MDGISAAVRKEWIGLIVLPAVGAIAGDYLSVFFPRVFF